MTWVRAAEKQNGFKHTGGGREKLGRGKSRHHVDIFLSGGYKVKIKFCPKRPSEFFRSKV